MVAVPWTKKSSRDLFFGPKSARGSWRTGVPNRADVTLLVGRAIRCDCFPLAWAEIKQASFLDPCLAYGKDYACPYPVGVFLVGEARERFLEGLCADARKTSPKGRRQASRCRLFRARRRGTRRRGTQLPSRSTRRSSTRKWLRKCDWPDHPSAGGDRKNSRAEDAPPRGSGRILSPEVPTRPPGYRVAATVGVLTVSCAGAAFTRASAFAGVDVLAMPPQQLAAGSTIDDDATVA